jgi:hypothetical protein
MAVYTHESGGLEEGEDGPLVHALPAGLPPTAQLVHLCATSSRREISLYNEYIYYIIIYIYI